MWPRKSDLERNSKGGAEQSDKTAIIIEADIDSLINHDGQINIRLTNKDSLSLRLDLP